MNVHTGLAVDAFRAHAGLLRRVDRMSAVLAERIALVPPAERGLYFAHTELIRLELDRRDAQAAGDTETEQAVDAQIDAARALIRAAEARVAKMTAGRPGGS